MATSMTVDGLNHPRPRGPRVRDPVLRTKITVPAVPGWVVFRPRIEKRIAEGVHGPLTVVTGPPGAGKTMAIASWAAGRGGGPVAWVTLDEYDNRPRTFWSYIVAALRQAGVGVSGAASALAHGEATGHVFLLQVASALAAHDPSVTLVLDDLHLVREPAALAGLEYVLRNARPGLHLVIASRMDPLLPLHRYRLTGELTEIRADDLAFNVAEAAVLMEQHGVTLPAESLEFVTRRDEGWAAGLRMAAISLRGHPDPGQFVKNLVAEDGAIAGYLVEEVLNAQPPAARDLLLRTSILSRVNADIAEELTGDRQAGSALAVLAEANAFVQPAGQGWYRYHALFKDVLRLKLRREQPSRVADLHRRAARWYQAAGALAAAVAHARKAGDRQLAARIIVDELAVGQLIEPRGDLPVDFFTRLPEGTAEPQSVLAAAAAAMPDARDQAAEAPLRTAEQILERLPADQESPSRLAAAMIRLALARRSGDYPAAAAAAARAGDLLHQLPEQVQAGHPWGRAHVLSGLGAVKFWSGDFAAAASFFDRAAALADGDGAGLAPMGHELAACHGHLALLDALAGRLSRAAELAAAGIVVPADGGAGRPCPAAAVAQALVHLERNELHSAHKRLKAADTALRAHPDKLMTGIACLVAARASLAEGRTPAAAEMLRRARLGWSPPPWLEHLLTVAQARVYAAAGDTRAACDAAGRAGPESALDAAVALARARLAEGGLQAARQALGDVTEAAHPDTPNLVRIEAWLTDALLSFRRGDTARGRRSLEAALRLAEPEGQRLPFAMERSWLRQAFGRHPDLAHAHRNLLEPGLAAAMSARAALHKAAVSQPAPMIVEQLTGRERDVLRHVGELLSTAEIASEMYISVNTVKTHLKSIFRKLEAADRREAVRRARQLGLV